MNDMSAIGQANHASPTTRPSLGTPAVASELGVTDLTPSDWNVPAAHHNHPSSPLPKLNARADVGTGRQHFERVTLRRLFADPAFRFDSEACR